jgi:hypothetical protein
MEISKIKVHNALVLPILLHGSEFGPTEETIKNNWHQSR